MKLEIYTNNDHNALLASLICTYDLKTTRTPKDLMEYADILDIPLSVDTAKEIIKLAKFIKTPIGKTPVVTQKKLERQFGNWAWTRIVCAKTCIAENA